MDWFLDYNKINNQLCQQKSHQLEQYEQVLKKDLKRFHKGHPEHPIWKSYDKDDYGANAMRRRVTRKAIKNWALDKTTNEMYILGLEKELIKKVIEGVADLGYGYEVKS